MRSSTVAKSEHKQEVSTVVKTEYKQEGLTGEPLICGQF
jgi:hypothetical protein